MLAKRFFYVSAGLLMLALVYHLGASNATAQGTTVPEVAVSQGESTTGPQPLPVYRDGTTADPADCVSAIVPTYASWRVPSQGTLQDWSYSLSTSSVDQGVAFVNVHSTANTVSSNARLHFMIIAVRGSSLPTAASRHTLGQLKQLYR